MAKIAMTSDKKIMILNESVEGIPSITVDSELINTSANPVQNKVIKAAIDAVDTKVGNKQDKIGVSGLLKCNGAGTVTAATAGTDYAAANHTHTDATTETSGFMSSADKTKLNGIANGANKTTVDSSLSSSSTNPVQNKVINTALNNKAPAYTYSTTDLTPGTSSLETGKLYIVYK